MPASPLYGDYTTEELFEALESIDEKQHLERAKKLVQCLIEKSGMSVQQLLEKYEYDSAMLISDILAFPIYTGFPNHETSERVTNKIHFILKHL